MWSHGRPPHHLLLIFFLHAVLLQVGSWEEAVAIENANPYGNAACIYTTVGAHAQWFQYRFRAAMIGINIGIPVSSGDGR